MALGRPGVRCRATLALLGDPPLHLLFQSPERQRPIFQQRLMIGAGIKSLPQSALGFPTQSLILDRANWVRFKLARGIDDAPHGFFCSTWAVVGGLVA